MKKKRTAYFLTICLVLCMVLGACTGKSAPTNFYLLNVESASSSPVDVSSETGHLKIGIGPVEIPAYLDRPQIVTRSGPNRLHLAEFDSWAEPLKETIDRLMVETISGMMDQTAVVVLPWNGRMTLDYQVVVEVIQMDNQKSGEAFLAVRWAMLKSYSNQIISVHRKTYSHPFNMNEIETYAAAHSRNFESLCRDISMELKALTDN
ncbi:MAG: PqiC family protein [Desulfobacterales bacterium]|nr:PqiC family protein [Desulfobacterales bacterium]